MEEQH